MTLSSGLRRLAAVVDELERADIDVRDASIDPASAETGHVHATVELSVPMEPAATTIAVDGSGQTVPDPDGSSGDRHQVAADADTAGASASNGDDREESSVAITATVDPEPTANGDAIPCPEPDCDATFASEPGMKVHRTKVHLSGVAGEDGPPAYRDPDRLAAVYESENTFPEMRDALDADVSAQTVRRHMIRHGIHDPDDPTPTQQPAADGEASTDAAQADADDDAADGTTDGRAVADFVDADLAIPADLDLGTLGQCVEAADTLYDVQQRFGIDRETARELLAAFDLLELVHGRVATKHERDRLKDEIDRRISATLADH